ncbi:MAG: glycosyltransferase [Arenicella sp.]|nr:glycosyltransferase [Arenicella sp.]
MKINVLHLLTDAEVLQAADLAMPSQAGLVESVLISTSMTRDQQGSADLVEALKADFFLLLPPGWRVSIDPLQKVELQLDSSDMNVRMIGPLGNQSFRALLLSKSRLLDELQNKDLGVILECRFNQPPSQSLCTQIDVAAVVGSPALNTALAKRLIDLDSTDINSWRKRAEILETLGHVDEARSVYSAVFEASNSSLTDCWFAAFRLAVLYAQIEGSGKEVIYYCERAFDLLPERCEPLVLLAANLREQVDNDSALQLSKVASEIPFDPVQEDVFKHTYRLGRHAERYRCAKQAGDDLEIISAVNDFTVAAYKGSTDPVLEAQMVVERNAAYRRTNINFPSMASKRNAFLVVIPFYNVGQLLRECVESVLEQTYERYEVVLIDDASNDQDTIELADLLARHRRVRLVRNQTNVGPLSNQMEAIRSCRNPNTIAVFLDGDDKLAHSGVLNFLNAAYHATGCWLTHGQWQSIQTGRQGYARPIMAHESVVDIYRNGSLVFPIHLRTHRVGLLHRLLEIDPDLGCFKNRRGKIVCRAADLAHMRAMMQLAGASRCQYMPEVLYLYNEGNPNSLHKIDRQGLIDDAYDVGLLPSLDPIRSYLPLSAKTRQASSTQMRASRAPARVVFLLLDGADPTTIKRLCRAGLMPNFNSIFNKAIKVDHFVGDSNSAFWKSVFTGEETGASEALYRTYRAQVDGERGSEFNHHAHLTVEGFWEHLAYKNYKVAVLNPPEVAIYQSVPNVTQISSWLVHAPTSRCRTEPPQLESALMSLSTEEVWLGQGSDSWGLLSDAQELELGKVLRSRNAVKTDAYGQLLAHADWDLFMCAYDGLHDALHKLWSSTQVDSQGHNLFEQSYIDLDHQLGKLLESCGDAEIYALAGLGGQTNGSQINAVLETTQEILNASDIQVSDVCFQLLDYTPNVAHIKFLVKGRDDSGVIEMEDLPRVMALVSQQWLALRGDDTGAPIVAEIVAPREQFPNKPYSSTLADLALIWNDYDLSEAYSSELLKSRTYRKNTGDILEFRVGDHSAEAVFYSNLDDIDEAIDSESLKHVQLGSLIRSRVLREPSQH